MRNGQIVPVIVIRANSALDEEVSAMEPQSNTGAINVSKPNTSNSSSLDKCSNNHLNINSTIADSNSTTQPVLPTKSKRGKNTENNGKTKSRGKKR